MSVSAGVQREPREKIEIYRGLETRPKSRTHYTIYLLVVLLYFSFAKLQVSRTTFLGLRGLSTCPLTCVPQSWRRVFSFTLVTVEFFHLLCYSIWIPTTLQSWHRLYILFVSKTFNNKGKKQDSNLNLNLDAVIRVDREFFKMSTQDKRKKGNLLFIKRL